MNSRAVRTPVVLLFKSSLFELSNDMMFDATFANADEYRRLTE